MSRLPDPPEDRHDTLPDALAADLRAIYGRGAEVPRRVDTLILAEARAGFARRRRFRLTLRGALFTAAAAAVILAFAIPALMRTDGGRYRPRPVASDAKMLMVAPPAPPPIGDVDHSGKVDILDAFVVARLIETRGAIDRAYDVNGDGRIDGADVDRIAMAAVDTSANSGERRVQ